MTRTLPATETGPVVGKPIDRVDGTAKTTGAARFSAEYPLPGLARAALVHATISRGRITAIGTEAAAAVPGVVAVLTHLNAPPLKPAPKVNPLNLSTLVSGTSVDYLNTDEVHWDGQPVAVVVADTLEAAREAAGLVTVTYETWTSTVDFAAEEKNAQPQKSTMIVSGGAKKGDAEAALAAAPVSLDLRFTTPPHHHNAIEPHATTASWDGDRLTVHEGTQSIDWVRTHLAGRFGVPPANVRVIAPFVGGGFGGKVMLWPGTIIAALAARATGRPVRLALTREGVYRTVGGRTPSTQRVALGADTDGKLTALVHTSVTRTGRVGGVPEQVTSQSRHLYAAENILVQHNLVELDLLSNTSMRAPGESIGTYALEASIDELAHRLGVDPIELRMRNEPATNPIDGKEFTHRMLREAYAQGAERFGWADRTPEPGSMRDGRWLVGMGVASAYHPAWQFAASVTVRLSVDGSVLVRCGFHEMGMGGATAQAQIAADALGVPFDAVRVEYGDSTLPVSPGAGGSMQTASIANSLLAACEKLKRELDKLAKRSGSAGMSPATILAKAGVPSVEAAIGSDTRFGRVAGQLKFAAKFLRDQRRWMKAACGAQFCEVRVDPDTGEVRVSRWTAVFDVGRVINAKTASSQLRGGIVMGIGMALAEETLVDPRTGRIMNPSLAEYHVPVHADIPPIDVSYLDDPDPTMPLGLIGVGEVGITGVAGAIANAVHHATGRRIHDLPITLDKLL
ncbi:carbon-monoxide dehydrogenase large subunit [Amycolatopsis mediterranei S699]|uniref:Carbon-monoxide dehydrogenase large subunit n=2 Tax=Amycolatopsis mediterranei TaxID=33910 RepID=A0A0H3D7C9_AMYMU|nr:xanthine dehydrogenase family protein molybdopterin-binding subunit [Amycolatopsis mediterranei]ADJ45424.1 carbon-monoxide dehydrogenase large subunit [Amycolatopsis mediterranei U32]AEK42190.1 carbon-monoxide dehydrogenase large subunit [Amycolatopsis mediterranei S699]AFO77136.1 carbon-monoxide dehydrogenase large subunit [Amycolatopsis mediterranei S699]AGT84264.1 carbon-monoxide dehydrogenase large subunit [Amycolatopsis mediterranei RB]KDO06003.1 carbon monoxide dehydrogenase [Amycolat